MPSPIFRLFISSTFADFRHEREALHTRVFPLLEAHCRAKGARFDVVDLRWGISPGAQDDFRTLKICIEEVERCRRIGLTPHFVALIGDRYGWEPAPVEIDAAHWQRMTRSSSLDRKVVEAFYRIDRNAAPHVYALKRDTYAKADASQRRALLAALRRLALGSGMYSEDHPSIFAAATHQEIIRGLMHAATPDQGIVYLRSIVGLPLSPAGGSYVDLTDNKFDADAHARVQGLKAQLRAYLPEANVREVSAGWANEDIKTNHIEGFCTQFLADHITLIDRSLTVAAAEESADQAHNEFARERARLFVGRHRAVEKILRYARTTGKTAERATKPLIVEGGGGTGKSALLAYSAQRLRADVDGAIVLERFIGAVAGSEDLAAVLNNLACAIAAAQGRLPSRLEPSFDAASAAFNTALETASSNRPICVFIDALDQLSPGDQLRLLDWLPDSLPTFARIILTARPGPMIREARRRYRHGVMRLAPMPASQSALMLDRLLADAGRTLTGTQRAKIRAASPGLPLWTRLAFEEARHWRSDEPGRRLERRVEGLIRARIADLSAPANHGAELVRDALGAIAASRFGLSDSEMAQALSQSLAPEVWAAFRARSFHAWEQPVLPAILWLRLHADIAPYLVEQSVDGALIYRFFHREFAEVVSEVVLQQEAKVAMHARLAAVFSEPSGAELYRACDASGLQDSRALRRLMEQPWQLAGAGLYDALAALLDDIGFVAGKCAANRVGDLMLDIATLEARREDGEDQCSEDWHARLRTWHAMLEHADSSWPAHRVLFQLLLESNAEAQPQRARAIALLQQAPPNWPVLLSMTAQEYTRALAQDLPSRPGLAGLAPMAGGYLADWDKDGGLRIVNRRSAAVVDRLELGSPRAARLHLADLANRFGAVQAVFDQTERNGADVAVNHDVVGLGLQLSWKWDGCLAVTRGAERVEIILGKGEIELAGETVAELFFRCDDRVLIIAKTLLAGLQPGLYTYSGSRVAGLAISGDSGGWTHQRFNSVIFIDPDTCLTLGFTDTGGQRDDIILELYKVRSEGVVRIAYGVMDHDLDLPIYHICGLNDGAIIIASEFYFRSFVWLPPFEYNNEVETLAFERKHDGSWVQPENGSVTPIFVPNDPSLKVVFDAPGYYGTGGGACHVCEGVLRIELNDRDRVLETTSVEGQLMRWHSDVRAHWIFEREAGDYIVFKNSGPVRVERWRG